MNYNTSHIEKIFQMKPYEELNHEKKRIFLRAVLEELRFHYENNVLFKNFCDKNNFIPSKTHSNLETLPSIPVQVFKVLGRKLSSVKPEDIKISLHSSATSGIPSTVLIDRVTLKRQQLTMAKVLSDFIGLKRSPFFIIDIDPVSKDRNQLGARAAAVRGYLNFSSSASYGIKYENNNLVFNQNAFEKFLSNNDNSEKVIIFGFTYVLYSCLIKNYKTSYTLPKGSKVIHIGGWKKLEKEKIPKEKFNKEISQFFQIEEKNIIDIYGFTEQMGLNYPDCEYGWKHLPIYAELFVRDPNTNKIMNNGEVGVLQFITPIPHSYPGNIVRTDDIGMIDQSEGDCACGRKGKRFKVLGRLKKAETRGCGDIMGEKIEEINLTDNENDKSLEILFHVDNLESNFEDITKIDKIIENVNSKKEWLDNQPVEALIGLIDMASKRWQDPSFELVGYKYQGLSFLVNWCQSNNLREILNNSLKHPRSALDSFIPVKGSLIRQITAKPKGLVVHWLSGNVPVLGMLILVQSIITKNVNILKASSSFSGAIPSLLNAFKDLEYFTPGGYRIKGNDMLKTISVIYYSHGRSDLANKISLNADLRIAWGGKEAVNHVLSLPKKWRTDDLIYGPKLSFMVIAKSSFDTERKIKKILRRAATDCSAFDQTACASPHTIFIEKNGLVSPKEFAQRLSVEMKKALMRIPVGEQENDQYNSVKTIREVYSFIGEVWNDETLDWTVLYDENNGLAEPIYSRVITVRPIESIFDTVDFVSEDIQTIGLAASGEERIRFAKEVAKKGVDRCPDIGLMTNFEVPWDGMIAIDRLIRWVTLGGPI